MPNPALTERLVEWLENERAAYLNEATRREIPLSVIVREPYFQQVDEPGGTIATEQDVQVSPLAVPDFAMWLLVNFERRRGLDPAMEDIARALVSTYGQGCDVWSFGPFTPDRFRDLGAADPLIDRCRGLLTLVRDDYLCRLPSFEESQESLARQLAGDLIALFETESRFFVTALPLCGIRGTLDRIETAGGTVVLRRLARDELASLLSLEQERPRRGRTFRPPRSNFSIPNERWALEVRTSCPKTEQPLPNGFERRIVLALQLLGFELGGTGTATTWTEPGPSAWSSGMTFRFPQWGLDPEHVIECTPELLERATRLASRIPEEVFANHQHSAREARSGRRPTAAGPRSRLGVALHRFHLGASDDSSSETLIDHVIVLESLLLVGTQESELSFRFRLFGAHYLSATPRDRLSMYRSLRLLYNLRSNLVHGSEPSQDVRDPNTVVAHARLARRLAGRALVKAVEEGMPTDTTFLSAALGAPSE